MSPVRGALWTVLRRALNFGTLRPPVKSAAGIQPGDRVLDVACGSGEFSTIVPPDCVYVGVDLDEANVALANRWYGSERHQFLVADVTKQPVEGGPFDVALALSLLHHLDDQQAGDLFSALASQVRRRLVVVDLLCVDGNPIQKFLVSMDQGHYPRPLWRQKELIEKYFEIERGDVFATRSGSATLSLFTCMPRDRLSVNTSRQRSS